MSLCAPHYEQHFDSVLSVSQSRLVAWGTHPLFQHLPALPLNCKWPQPEALSSLFWTLFRGWDLHTVGGEYVSLYCFSTTPSASLSQSIRSTNYWPSRGGRKKSVYNRCQERSLLGLFGLEVLKHLFWVFSDICDGWVDSFYQFIIARLTG